MKTESKYFKIPINAKSPEELAKRIADNELRGFELVAIYDVEKNEHVYRNGEYGGLNVHKGYRAVMQRKSDGR